MSARSRLRAAIDDGALTLSSGEVTLVRPPAGYDLGDIAPERVTIVHGFYPDVAAWRARGFTVEAEMARTTTAIVVVPRVKALARDLVAQAAALADHVIVDGQKTDGVDGLFRDCRKALGALPSVTADHGRLFWFAGTTALDAWRLPPPSPNAAGFITTAGVFSSDGVDPASALLAEALPPALPRRMADLGAGWGFLAAAALARSGVAQIDLIEAEALALDCARRNITDDRARFIWGDATRHVADMLYDGIVMNPPFHPGRAPDAALGQAFIAAAARLLAPHGQLWMVANRHLPYEDALRRAFRRVEDIGGNAAFKIIHAARPAR